MSVDLKCSSLLRRRQLVVEPAYLVILEGNFTNDRMKRILFDQVSSVAIWRRLPWLRMLALLLICAGPSVLFFAYGGYTATVIASSLLVAGLFAAAWQAYCGKTYIRIVRRSEATTFATYVRRGRVKRFIDLLTAAIDRTQAAAAKDSAFESMSPEDAPPTDVASSAPTQPDWSLQ